jgi:DNA-binding transcriptional ArsR family regulator
VSRRAGGSDQLWAAVGDSTRRRLLDVLLARGEATATTLAGELPVTRQAVAKHLAVLDRAGLVEARRRGREVRYGVRPDRLDDASRAMAQVAAQWDERLAAIKKLAQAAQRGIMSGMPDLEPAIRQMFDATNSGDVASFLDAFADDAVLVDWGRTFTGRDEIAGWNERENVGVNSHIEVTGVEREGGAVRVAVQVTGDGYNGGGAMTFELAGDRIARMVITG